MRLAAIIPVKTFSNAKSRLGLPCDTRDALCRMMLEEVLRTVSLSPQIDSVVVVSGDQAAFDVARPFGVVEIEDAAESGVNDAVALADRHLTGDSFDASVVFPQDIPFMMPQDIDFMLRFWRMPSCIVVPSRRLDGTNALLRAPADLMGTHYDEDSYTIHLSAARQRTANTSLVFIRRMMLDIDERRDIEYCMRQDAKPGLVARIRGLLG